MLESNNPLLVYIIVCSAAIMSASTDVHLTIMHGGSREDLVFSADSTLMDLSSKIETAFSVPTARQKLIVPRLGLLKPPFKDPSMPLQSLVGRSITLLGSTEAVVSSMQEAESLAVARYTSRAVAAVRRPTSATTRAKPDQYTFATIRPMQWLPHPERSLRLLERLANDPGIRYTMRIHKFSVALLTEMEPLSNTSSTHEGTTRILGLNRNKGEVIELRLRTDAHDGYRDYATVRRTLCHELTHNVHGPHDAAFWKLCKQIEQEVETFGAGRVVGGGEEIGRYSAPARDEEEWEQDHGGWTGGEFVLGTAGASDAEVSPGLSRRDILARAAEERARQARSKGDDADAP